MAPLRESPPNEHAATAMPAFAAIDIGSNSCRLKIAKAVAHHLKTLAEDREVTPDEFAREVAALGGEHAARFIALYCGLCQLVYCFDHGTVDYSDEPPHAFGMCPQAHWRVIDMG